MEVQILTLVIGFILTTVGGGVLGYYFQRRNWKHQNTAKVMETEHATATAIFENISTLMDKRLYRMRLLCWSVEAEVLEDQVIEEHRQLYRQVLYDWNDTLIRNLALTQAYFGNAIRDHLENKIYEEFKRIGEMLEWEYRDYKTKGKVSEPSVSTALSSLSDQIYHLNFQMITFIQKRKVGIFHPDSPDYAKYG
jgi:hypothetical protein